MDQTPCPLAGDQNGMTEGDYSMIAKSGLKVSILLAVLAVVCMLSTCGEAEPTAVEEPTATEVSATDTFMSPLKPESGFKGLLAFHSDRTGAMQVYLMQGDTLEQTRLTEEPNGAFEPGWAPLPACVTPPNSSSFGISQKRDSKSSITP